jgi:hypothetical protein
MRLTIAAAAAIAWGVLVLGTVSGADAQPRKRQVAYTPPGPGSTTIVSRDERGRVRTKILVQKRSYLDGGTEVMPGDISGTTRDSMINSFYYNPSRASVSNDNIVPSRPIPDPFFLPGNNNPFFN